VKTKKSQNIQFIPYSISLIHKITVKQCKNIMGLSKIMFMFSSFFPTLNGHSMGNPPMFRHHWTTSFLDEVVMREVRLRAEAQGQRT
jgi:hypothetical protein